MCRIFFFRFLIIVKYKNIESFPKNSIYKYKKNINLSVDENPKLFKCFNNVQRNEKHLTMKILSRADDNALMNGSVFNWNGILIKC